MEQENFPLTPPEAIPCPCDQEVFARVWRRVMPEDRPDCPFLLEEEEAVPALAPLPCAAEEPPAAPAAPAVPLPAVREDPCPCGQETPDGDVPCLGSASAVHGPQIQQYIDLELADWRAYLLLSRRAQGGAARVLATIAADERRHAKRLSTAYFLISGVRYWPAERAAAPSGLPFLAALREHFMAEQRGEAAYRAAAAETSDPCLQELYLELAGDENAHAWLLRGILEQM